MEMNETFYYNPQRLLSYNCLWNFINGERGNGKTYAFKKLCIDRFIKHEEEFIWLRRYETELADIRLWFNDIKEKYPNYEFKVNAGKFYINDKVAGYYFPLSKALTKKSVPYPNVKRIVFDEYIIAKGNYHYLRNEVRCLQDLYETVARTRDVYLYCIANSISELNPYHIYFNMVSKGRFTRIQEDMILETTDTINYRQAKANTRYGKMIKDTDYGRFAIDNEFVEDNHEFIEQKTPKAINRFNIKIGTKTIGIWMDTSVGKIFCCSSYNSTLPMYCITTNDMKPNYLILKATSNYMKTLKNAFEYGFIYYESMKIKGYMQDVQRYLNIK